MDVGLGVPVRLPCKVCGIRRVVTKLGSGAKDRSRQMTPERQKLRARIEKARITIDRYEADLQRALTNIARDTLRKRRLAAGEERLWSRLRELP